MPGPHSHPSTPKSRPKRCVETPGDPWDASQPPGSFHPAYGMPPTANRWLPPLSSSQREQSLSVQRCSQWELSPGATTRREEIPGLYPVYCRLCFNYFLLPDTTQFLHMSQGIFTFNKIVFIVLGMRKFSLELESINNAVCNKIE